MKNSAMFKTPFPVKLELGRGPSPELRVEPVIGRKDEASPLETLQCKKIVKVLRGTAVLCQEFDTGPEGLHLSQGSEATIPPNTPHYISPTSEYFVGLVIHDNLPPYYPEQED